MLFLHLSSLFPCAELLSFQLLSTPATSALMTVLMPPKILAIVNSTGRQAASVARVAAAVGDHVRAHVNKREGVVAQELEDMENVTVIEGSLEDRELVARLFAGAHRAFINTISWGDEVAIGIALADAAKKAGVQHYIYSSMPDHSVYGKGWPALPLWSVKFTVENYVRQVNESFIRRQQGKMEGD